MTISQFLKGTVGESYEITGIVVGPVSSHATAELLIKEKGSMTFISVLSTGIVGTNYDPALDTTVVNVGDEIIFTATLTQTPATSSYKGNRERYTANVTDSASFKSSLIIGSQNNSFNYDLSNATEISTQAQLKAFLDDRANLYKIAKLCKPKAIQYKNSSGKLGYRIFFGDTVTSDATQKINTISPFIYMNSSNFYLTNGVKSYFTNPNSTTYSSPAKTEYDVYAILIGGNSYYYDFIILDD